MFNANAIKIVSVTLVSAVIGSAAIAAGPEFERVDTDRDGHVSLIELQSHYPTVGEVTFETYADDMDEGMTEAEYIEFEEDAQANRLPAEDK